MGEAYPQRARIQKYGLLRHSCVRLAQAHVLLHIHLQIKSASLFGATNFPGWAICDSELSVAGVSHGVTIDELPIDVCASPGTWLVMALSIFCLAAGAISNKIWTIWILSAVTPSRGRRHVSLPSPCAACRPSQLPTGAVHIPHRRESDRTVCHRCPKVTNVLLAYKQVEHWDELRPFAL